MKRHRKRTHSEGIDILDVMERDDETDDSSFDRLIIVLIVHCSLSHALCTLSYMLKTHCTIVLRFQHRLLREPGLELWTKRLPSESSHEFSEIIDSFFRNRGRTVLLVAPFCFCACAFLVLLADMTRSSIAESDYARIQRRKIVVPGVNSTFATLVDLFSFLLDVSECVGTCRCPWRKESWSRHMSLTFLNAHKSKKKQHENIARVFHMKFNE